MQMLSFACTDVYYVLLGVMIKVCHTNRSLQHAVSANTMHAVEGPLELRLNSVEMGLELCSNAPYVLSWLMWSELL